MLQQLVFMRHTECEKPRSENAILENLQWGLTAQGIADAERIGTYINERKQTFDMHITGSALRLRQTAFHLNLDGDPAFYVEDYLNGRMRSGNAAKSGESSHDALFSALDPQDERFFDFIQRGAERLLDRIRRRCDGMKQALIVAPREFIVAIRFRLRGLALNEKRATLQQLSHRGAPSDQVHELDVLPGELLTLSSTDPKSGKSLQSFRWEKRENPLVPSRDLDWKYFEVQTYRRDKLLDCSLWGDRRPQTDQQAAQS